MSLEDLGNIGEFVAAVGVIASLIYLAVQIRQNTKWARHQTFQSSLGQTLDWYRLITEDDDVARIYVAGCESFEQLSYQDKVRFSHLMVQAFAHCEVMLQVGEDRLLREETIDAVNRFIIRQFGHPGVRSWWEQEGRSVLARDFRDHVDRVAAG